MFQVVSFSPSGTGELVRFRIADGDFNTSPDDMAADLTFLYEYSISSVSITETFNSYFSANNITAEATITSSGKLELRSTETGEDAKISITGIDAGIGINLNSSGELSKLGFIQNQNDLGEPGEPAKYIGSTHESISTVGFEMDGLVTFNVLDRYGTNSQPINYIWRKSSN